MDGIHDLGGRPGFGKVDPIPLEPVFKSRWEAKVFTLVNAAARAGAYQSVDQFRHAVERIDPEAYLTHGYYGRWLGGLETLLVEAGILSSETITLRATALGARPEDLIAARPQRVTPRDGGIPAEPYVSQTVHREANLFVVILEVFSRGQLICCPPTGWTSRSRD